MLLRLPAAPSRLCAVLAAAATAAGGLPAALAQAPADVKVNVTRQAYPTGDTATSVVLLERANPREVRAGEGFEYQIRLTNLTNRDVKNVMLAERLPADFAVARISPQPDKLTGDRATWNLGTLGPKASKVFRISGSASRVGDLPACATVTFSTRMCSTTRIVEPGLRLTKNAPERAMLCDPVTLTYVVTNPGSGVARKVTVSDALPEGWETTDGRNQVAFRAGDLPAGQSRRFTVEAKASSTGRFGSTARAREEGGLTAEARAETRIVRPVLAVTANGPSERYLGRPATFEFTVRNEGDAPARDVTLVDSVPAGTNLLKVSDGGRPGDGRVTWSLGTINPGDARSVQVTLTATRPGTLRTAARARAYCAAADVARSMEVLGVPAILLEVVDVDDPIELGANVVYQIVVLNQGSADGTNIVITCSLPEEQQFVSGDGPTRVRGQGQDVVFAALPRLAPGARVTYRVVAMGAGAGDVRFRVSLTSDQLTEPVTETESTHIY